jgi:hypothetical protein
MKITTVKLTGGAKQTGKEMHRLADSYAFDMAPWASTPLTVIFRKIADIPFRADPEGHELVQRPIFTMRNGGDCDDKSICMAAWAILNKVKYRFCAVGRKIPGKIRIPLTHVFTEVKINNEWISADCTYAYNILGQRSNNYDRMEYI